MANFSEMREEEDSRRETMMVFELNINPIELTPCPYIQDERANLV